MKKTFLIIALSATAISTHADAACLPAELCARISNLVDKPLGTFFGTGDKTDFNSLCPYVQNDDESNYVITVTGDGGANEFITSNGTTDLPITVEYEETAQPYATLVEATPTTFANPETVDETCGGAGGAGKVQVTIAEADMQAATAGTYTGTIQIVISPD